MAYLIALLGALAAALVVMPLIRLMAGRDMNTLLFSNFMSEGQTAQERDIQREANFVALAVAIGFFGAVYMLWTSLLLSGALAIFAGVITPTLYRERKTKIALAEIDMQLPVALQLLSNSFKADRSLNDCIGDVANNAVPPISLEFAQMMREARTGGTSVALKQAWRRLPIRNFRTTTVVLQIVQDRGGDLAATATALAETFREVHKLEAKSKTASQQTRAAMMLVTVAPIGIMLMMFFFQPESIDALLGTPVGWGITAAAATLYVVALTMMRKLMSVQI